METSFEHVPEAATLGRTVAHVQSYVLSEPGAYTALIATANDDPEGTTASLLALGAVLLDLAAGAFSISPDEMLAKVSAQISLYNAETADAG